MLFTSYRFIAFLLVLFFAYYLIPKRFQWKLLLVASYLFYIFAGPKYLIYILVTTLSTYYVSLRIDRIQSVQAGYLKENKGTLDRKERKAYKAQMKKRQRQWMIPCMVFNFGILAVLKYADFTIGNLNGLLRVFHVAELPLPGFLLPLGISFYTFQTMGYLIDVYRGKYPCERNIGKLALFISFFPQLIQGPISRFDDLKETMFSEHSLDLRDVSFGLERILWGYFKKLVVADKLLVAVNTIVKTPGQYQGAYVLAGMFFYAITLYADFTGGIDVAIGVGQVLGIRIQENFIRPYFSKSIAEYWRRWHISLGAWFREYLFYPISVSKPLLDSSRRYKKRGQDWLSRRLPIYVSSVIVWFVTGIWHGAAWNFIVWGLLNCLVILISEECKPLYEKFHKRFSVKGTFWYRLFEVVRTFWLMSFLRALDCYRDVGTTFRLVGTIFTKWNIGELFRGGLMQLGLSAADYGVLAVAVLLLLAVSLMGRTESVREKLAAKPVAFRYAACFAMFTAILIFGAYGAGYDASQFIYSQF